MCSPDQGYKSLHPSVQQFYRMFKRNIIQISAKSGNLFHEITTDSGKLCFYLKYWFYDWIISKNIEEEKIAQLLNLWDKQKKVVCTECDCEFFVRKLLEINKLKKFYDFYLFSEKFRDVQSMNNEINDKEYCNHLKNAMAEHSHLKTMNYSKNPKYREEIFSYIIPYVKTDNYSLIYCDENKSVEEDGVGLGGDGVRVGGDKVVGVTDRVGGNRDEVGGIKEEEEGEPYEEDSKDLHASPDFALKDEGPVPGSSFSLSDDGELTDPINLGTDSTDNKSSTGSIVSASSLGIIGISFLLYKFTPFRSWIDPRIRKTKDNLINQNQVYNELQYHEHNYDPTDMDFNRYNIAYQPK
ncbi:Plasmodium vivax Vir protein, putative [Plasmodium vivax]|uniref:Vir protein, putative n=1 Tax=Plasmodium vivax TaxID=5855 RepID=A0A1G4EBQ0_PLAVI|nr:Plasmodium vivax Vir protein, putative [Plasmodium vivax]